MSETTVKISCSINTTDPLSNLGVEILIDNQKLCDIEHISEPVEFNYDLPDDDGDHKLTFVLKNKTDSDTIIDDTGNIVKDARIIISNLSFDEIALNQIFIDQAVYTHNFNGNGETVHDKFYGEIGCNGTVSLDFSTPVYLWLLENM
jgi:hypothetical protein